MYFGTFIIYSLLLIIETQLGAKADQIKSENSKPLKWAFALLFLFSALRFYVGNDYANYVEIFYQIQYDYNPMKTEPAFYILCWPFFGLTEGYLYVFALCSFISLYFVFKTIVREECVSWGLFVFITLEFLIFCNDCVRQGVAMSIAIYSLEYARQKKYIKYILLIALASMFHYTACVMLIFIFARNIKIKKKYYLIATGIAVVLYITGQLTPYIVKAIGLTPFYGEHYLLMHENQFVIEKTSTGLGLLFKIILLVYSIMNIDKVRDNYYLHLFVIGSIIRICVTGFMLPERIALYLVFANYVGFAQLLQVNKKKIHGISVIALIVLYFSLQSLFALENHGAVPYRTLFFEDFGKIHYEYVGY